MATTRPHLKFKIAENEMLFYVFRLSPSEYLLYDSGMGDPVEYGSLNKVSAKLASHQEELKKRYGAANLKVWKFQRDLIKGWKLADTMNGIPYSTPEKNSVASVNIQTPRSPLKDIGTDSIYYWIDLGKMQYLYDSDLGSPIWFGTTSKIAAAIALHSKNHPFSVQMFHFPTRAVEPRWKMNVRYKISADKERDDLKEKKAKEVEPPKK